MRLDADVLFVAATDREAAPFKERGLPIAVTGIGKVNAAVVASLALSGRREASAVVSVGVAGSLPGVSPPGIGDCVVGTASVSAEDGLLTPDGFIPVDQMGFPLAQGVRSGRFPAAPALLHAVQERLPSAHLGDIATVSTCSGTDAAALEVVQRTGAVAEAMEGVGVLQAAAQLGAAGLEVRAISNTTGRRDRQAWDLDAALATLGLVADAFIAS